MKIVLIEAPFTKISPPDWENEMFPEMPFQIDDFLSNRINQLEIWDFQRSQSFSIQSLIQQIQRFQPAVVGINDRYTTNGLVIETWIKQLFPPMMVFYVPNIMTKEHLLELANQAAFSLRHRTKPMAGRIRMRRTWKDEELFSSFSSLTQREQATLIEHQYCQTYHLETWKETLSANAYRKNLYLLEILEHYFNENLPLWQQTTLRIFDVGAGQWVYGPILYQFFKYGYTQQPRTIYLTGIEIDPYRIDEEGYSSVDYARSYIDPVAPYCRYLIEDILHHCPNEPYDVIIQLLPFVLDHTPLYWGLPCQYVKPNEMIAHMMNLLKPDGFLLIANEIPEEFAAQQALFQRNQIQPLIAEPFLSQIRCAHAGFFSLVQKVK